MINFGNIKSKISQAYYSDVINESNWYGSLYKEYIKTIKSSPVLMLEYVIYQNLKKNNMGYDESLRYIDENILALSKIDAKKLNEENLKLEKFYLTDIKLDSDTEKLNNSIHSIITESILKTKSTNINKLHSSVNLIVENLTKKIVKDEQINTSSFDSSKIFNMTKKRLEESIQKMDDEKIELINLYIKKDFNELKNKFNLLKEHVCSCVKNDSKLSKDIKDKSIDIINEMNFDSETFVENINKLYQIKEIDENT